MTGLPVQGSAAPPRLNGELVFERPWERDVFGLAMALLERQVISWSEFQPRLIEVIARGADSDHEASYYTCWAAALERVLADKGILDPGALEAVARDHVGHRVSLRGATHGGKEPHAR